MKQIISCSYRDDTPAFFSEEFFRDVRRGLTMVNTKYGLKAVSLRPEDVSCFVFWTKNPSDHFLQNMASLRSPFYIQWTITGYGQDLERNLPPKDTVIQRFQQVSQAIGAKRVWWRYDPVLINDSYDITYHKMRFAAMARSLKGYTTHCVISFLDEYGKIQDQVKAGAMRAPTLQEIHEMAASFAASAAENGITVQTCSEGQYDLTQYGIQEAPCIDAAFIERELKVPLSTAQKHPGGFRRCKCCANTDIGAYHRCRHGCTYCYAK